MTRVVLLLAVVLAGCGSAATSEVLATLAPANGGSPTASLVPGAPSVRGALDPGDGNQTGLSSEDPVARASMTGGAPKPTGGIDKGYYCSDPPECGYETPKPPQKPIIPSSDGIAGQATWWNSFGSGYYVAIRPDLGSKGDLVIVCGGEPFHCVTAPVITSCACLGPNSDRLVDLSADLFREFAPLSAGVVRITLQVVGR